MNALKTLLVITTLLLATTSWANINCPKKMADCPQAKMECANCPNKANAGQCDTCPKGQQANGQHKKMNCQTKADCPKKN